MAQKGNSGTGNRKLPGESKRNKDGQQVFEDECYNAKRMSKLHKGEGDLDEEEAEFAQNLKDFGDFGEEY